MKFNLIFICEIFNYDINCNLLCIGKLYSLILTDNSRIQVFINIIYNWICFINDFYELINDNFDVDIKNKFFISEYFLFIVILVRLLFYW